MYDMFDTGRLDWNSTIGEGETGFPVLPEGEYPFTVLRMRKGWHDGTEKTPACNKAILTLGVRGNDGQIVRIPTSLLLHRNLEWKLDAFFRSVCLKKRGEPLTMDWDRVTGTMGKAQLTIHTYRAKDGTERRINSVKNYLDPDAASPEEEGGTAR